MLANVIYIERTTSLVKLFQSTNWNEGLVVTKNGLRYERKDGKSLFFHPNLAQNKNSEFSKGRNRIR